MSLVQTMTLKQLESTLDLPEQVFANDLLSWFVSKNESKVHSDEFTFSGKRIYRFCANFTGTEGMSGFGRSQDELTAAVKACAEALERTTYREFIKQNGSLNLQIQQTLSGMKIESNDHPKQIAPSFQNSNGWAVGFSSSSAIERAKVEALERHLLLLTFIKDGWNECHLVIKGNRLQHFINGVLMSDITDNDTANRKMSGLLGLQIHAGHIMKVEYRNMRIKQ